MKNPDKSKEQLLKEIDKLKSKISEMKKSNKGKRTLIENIPIGISISTPEGDILDVNETILKIFGYDSKKEFVNTPAADFYFDPKDRDRFVKLHKKGLVKDLEFQFKRKDGSAFWGAVTSKKVTTKEGNIEFINTFWEITGRKQAEEALLKSNSLLTSIIESPDKIIMFALDTNYNYLGFNNAHVKEMKQFYDADIKVGQSILSYLPNEAVRLKAEINYKRVLKGERFAEIQENGKSGHRFWYELIFNPIIDNSNKITGFTVFVSNITARKLAEEQLRESEAKFKSLVTNNEEIIYIIDKDGTFLLSEGKGLATLGLKSGQVVGQSVFDLYKEYPEMLDEIRRVFNGETIISEVYVGGVHFRNWYTPQTDNKGRITGLLGLSINISDLKLAESQKENAIRELNEHKAKLEEIVKERTTELKEKNKELDETLKVFVGRELKIKELQTKIKAIED